MALKGDRNIEAYELSYFLDETATRGVVASVSTAGSGVAMDSTSNVATVAANSSGAKPLGVLLNDFVDIDLSRQVVNPHKFESNKGDKASLVRRGWVVTDQITGTPTAGQLAALSSSGTVTSVADPNTHDELLQPYVGRFITGEDEDGYAKVQIDL